MSGIRDRVFGIVLATLFAIGWGAPWVVGLAGLQGCTQTRNAYAIATDHAELAYVLAEHYSTLVKAAADLADRPTTPASAIKAMQLADAKAKPIIQTLRPLRDAYLATKSASTEAELQQAADRAVLAIGDLVRAINNARGVK